MNVIYNQNILFLFLGGIFSLILTVAVLFIRQDQKRAYGRKLLGEKAANNPEYGDIETKLNESVEFQKPVVSELAAAWGLQPLYIIAFASLLTQTSQIEIIGLFILTVIFILHEFVWVSRYAKNITYQVFILVLWVMFYFLIAYKANENHRLKERQHKNENIKGANRDSVP